MGAAGGVVLGVNAFSLNDIDILSVKSSLIINEEERAKGMASEVLGNPIVAVAWLANKLSESELHWSRATLYCRAPCTTHSRLRPATRLSPASTMASARSPSFS